MHYKIKELHKLITYLVNEEGISDYAEKMLEGYAFSLEAVIKENCNIQPVSERYLLVEWLNGNPILDGATYFDSKEECLEYYNNLPKLKGFNIEHTIFRISNDR